MGTYRIQSIAEAPSVIFLYYIVSVYIEFREDK